jgi:hypothetical protein
VRKGLKNIGMGQKIETWDDSLWAGDQNWSGGCRANEDICYLDGHGYFQKRRKEKEKERKARMMKGKVEKANQIMSNLRPHQFLLSSNNNKKNKNILSSLLFCSFGLSSAWFLAFSDIIKTKKYVATKM